MRTMNSKGMQSVLLPSPKKKILNGNPVCSMSALNATTNLMFLKNYQFAVAEDSNAMLLLPRVVLPSFVTKLLHSN